MKNHLSVTINMGGQERNLKFTMEAIRKTEAVIPWKDISKIPENMSIPESCLAQVLYFALEGGGEKGLNPKKVEKWKEVFVEDYSRDALIIKLVYAIYASGIMGSTTRFKELMDNIENAADEGEDEEKND